MPRSCAAINCSTTDLPGKKISFFKYPLKHPELLKKWISATRRKNFHPGSGTFLCEQHFRREDFLSALDARRGHLRSHAVPSIFDFTDNKKTKPNKTNKPRFLIEQAGQKFFNEVCLVRAHVTLLQGGFITLPKSSSMSGDVLHSLLSKIQAYIKTSYWINSGKSRQFFLSV